MTHYHIKSQGSTLTLVQRFNDESPLHEFTHLGPSTVWTTFSSKPSQTSKMLKKEENCPSCIIACTWYISHVPGLYHSFG